jgi:hypothetical protein
MNKCKFSFKYGPTWWCEYSKKETMECDGDEDTVCKHKEFIRPLVDTAITVPENLTLLQVREVVQKLRALVKDDMARIINMKQLGNMFKLKQIATMEGRVEGCLHAITELNLLIAPPKDVNETEVSSSESEG